MRERERENESMKIYCYIKSTCTFVYTPDYIYNKRGLFK